MKLSVVIVNYNVKYFLEQALLAVRSASTSLDTEVWVVDNHSVDGSVAMVQEKFPEVQLIANTDNPGFAKANNQALRQAKGKYCLLLNPDTVVETETFRKCIAFMDAHPNVGGLGVRMIDGSGTFLPESKRGFPTPWVAFCKTTGLSTLFPRSPFFNRYHLGFLPETETNSVDVLSGAFMFLRKTVLDKIGLLDESFFMYGEDIDLSYRIKQAGYQNYYLPDTTIIHYKGESTKKGSLNYVRVFYQAMTIFARKHFQGLGGHFFVWFLQAAIVLRGLLSIVGNIFRRLLMPLADALVLAAGLWISKEAWEGWYFSADDYYNDVFFRFNVPLYTSLWLLGIYLRGGYRKPFRFRKLVQGVLLGLLLIAATYGFLEMTYRSSRALIVLGTLSGILLLPFWRLALQFISRGRFRLDRPRVQNLVIAGDTAEIARARHLLQRAGVQKKIVGAISPAFPFDATQYIGTLQELPEIASLYRIDEVVFCARDIPSSTIMYWMNTIGPGLQYKILPEESMGIVGSHSKDDSGELYTIDIRFSLSHTTQKRLKRVVDIGIGVSVLGLWPVLGVGRMLAGKKPDTRFWRKAAWQVLTEQKTWISYGSHNHEHLPRLKTGVFSPSSHISAAEETKAHLDFLYARDYTPWLDVEYIWKAMGK